MKLAEIRRFTDKGAIIVGSQAECFALNGCFDPTRDWDLLVPHALWRNIVTKIPMTAKPNGFRGWRFEIDTLRIDIWPDDLARYLQEATEPTRANGKPGKDTAWALDLNGRAFNARRL